jgi:hypothetical protein
LFAAIFGSNPFDRNAESAWRARPCQGGMVTGAAAKLFLDGLYRA